VDLLADLGLDRDGILLGAAPLIRPSCPALSHGRVLDSRRMRLLAVETSSLAGGVSLLDDERLVAEYLLDVSLTHSERLMSAIDSRACPTPGGRPACCRASPSPWGRASFTGLRIAVSTVKGLALALDLPIAAVPTLDAMAAALPWAALPVMPGARCPQG